jgi:DNA-binding transcriptional regulator YiaG
MTRLSEMTPGEMLPLITRRHISPAAARAFRERRGATHEEMADVLGVSPGEVAAWEAGTMRVPSAPASLMRSMAESAPWRWQIPPGVRPPWCPWVNANVRGLYEEIWRFPGELRFTDPVQRHVDACAECQRVIELRDAARTDPALERGMTVPPEDVGPVMTAGEAILFYVLIASPLIAMFALFAFGPALDGPAADLGTAAGAGSMALLFTEWLVGWRLPRRPYATGFLSAGTGMLAGMLTWTLQGPGNDLVDPFGLAGCAAVALLLGLLTGWRRDGYEPDDAEPPRTEADATTPDPAVLLAAPDPLAALDEVRARPRPEHAGASRREGA